MEKTIGELMKLSCKYLKEKGINSAEIEVETLLSWILNVPRTELYLKSKEFLCAAGVNMLREAIRKRASRMPLAYIIGKTEFYGLEFAVNQSCLIPRQETEILVDETIKICQTHFEPSAKEGIRILELGCGCGNIAVALAKNIKNSTIYCVDIDEKVLELTCRNAIDNGVYSQLRVYKGDLFSPFENNREFLCSFDIIVSNPPYVPESIIPGLDEEVSLYEPKIALCGGADGLDFYRRIIPASKFFLNAGGKLLLEIGYNQSISVLEILKIHGYDKIRIVKDLSNIDRVIVASN